MKNKYINMIKWSFVILIVLLMVVCFLLGSSYSNFVYNSNNHRAVEMIVSKLNYKVRINEEEKSYLDIKPGINLFNIEIESLNKVESYFKFLVENKIEVFYIDDFLEGLINSEEKKSFRIIVFNTNDSNIKCNYFIASGYANNKLDDIEIPDNYKEVAIKFSVFNRFKYKDSSLDYKLLSINDNNTLDIISMEAIESNNLITGSLGYLNLEEELNTNVNIPNTRIVTISDIEKYTNQSIVEINAKDYKRDIVFYIPYKNDYNYILNGSVKTSEIIIKEPTKSVYDEVFYNTNYLLNNSYSKLYNDYIEWGVFSIENGKLKTNRLYDFNNNESSVPIRIKTITTLTSDSKIEYDYSNDLFLVK